MKLSHVKILEILPAVGLLLGTIFVLLNIGSNNEANLQVVLVSLAFPFVTGLAYVTGKSLFHIGVMEKRMRNGSLALVLIYLLSLGAYVLFKIMGI